MAHQVGYWVLVAIGFGFLIFVHELGHFIAAKGVGIRVIRFALGFGPRLFGKKIGETDYCVCVVPCGGYVRMAGGEGEGGEGTTGAPDEFPSKTLGQRALVVIAGPLMSILIAVPLFFALFTAGLDGPSSRIGHVVPGMAAWKSDLRRGDLITGIKRQDEDNWRKIRLGRQVKLNQVLKEKVGKIVVRVRRNGREKFVRLETDEEGYIGLATAIVGRQMGYAGSLVGYIPTDSPAADAGLRPGCRILELAGRRTCSSEDIKNAVVGIPGEEVDVRFELPETGERRTSRMRVPSEKYWWLGIQAVRPNVVRLVRPNFPADAAGMKPGDVIIAIDDQQIEDWRELERAVMAGGPREAEFTVRRSETTLKFSVRLQNGEELGDVLGVAPPECPVITGFATGSNAPKAGAVKGAKLLRLGTRDKVSRTTPGTDAETYGGHSLKYISDIRMFSVGSSHDPKLAPGPVNVLIENQGRRRIVEVEPVFGEWGVPGFGFRLDKCPVVEPGNVVQAAGQALRKTVEWVGLACKTLVMLVSGRFTLDMVSGPLGILAVSRSQAEVGLLTFVEFLAIITVHLGIINLVPFPVLDGGHLGFLLVEKLRGKPLTEKVMGRLMYAGMVLLISLMLFVTWNDISRLLGLS